MFRFSIRELMLVTLVVALAVGGFVDRRITAIKIKDLESRLVPVEKDYLQREVSDRIRVELMLAEQAGRGPETAADKTRRLAYLDSQTPDSKKVPVDDARPRDFQPPSAADYSELRR